MLTESFGVVYYLLCTCTAHIVFHLIWIYNTIFILKLHMLDQFLIYVHVINDPKCLYALTILFNYKIYGATLFRSHYFCTQFSKLMYRIAFSLVSQFSIVIHYMFDCEYYDKYRIKSVFKKSFQKKGVIFILRGGVLHQSTVLCLYVSVFCSPLEVLNVLFAWLGFWCSNGVVVMEGYLLLIYVFCYFFPSLPLIELELHDLLCTESALLELKHHNLLLPCYRIPSTWYSRVHIFYTAFSLCIKDSCTHHHQSSTCPNLLHNLLNKCSFLRCFSL